MYTKQLLTTMIGVGMLSTALLLWAWPQAEPATAIDRQPVRAVQVRQVTTLDHARSLRFPGVTRAARRAALTFVAPARLTSRPVEVGDRVFAGQVLARLDDREFRHAVHAAEATLAELQVRLAQAERDRSRVRQLVGARAATAEELEQVSALADALAAAQNAASVQLQDARRLLDESVLRAPFAGTVTAVLLEPGEWAMPGRPVVELSGTGRLEIRLEVPETVVAGLAAGQEVQVELPFLDHRTSGTIATVTRAAIGAGRLFPVVIELPDDHQVGAGMTAQVVLAVRRGEALAVPLAAVLDPGSSRPSVFCVRSGRAEQVPVELGELVGELVMVDARLVSTDLVVTAGHGALSSGDQVRVDLAGGYPEVTS